MSNKNPNPVSFPLKGVFFLNGNKIGALPVVHFIHKNLGGAIFPQKWWEDTIREGSVIEYQTLTSSDVLKFKLEVGVRYKWFFYPVTVVWTMTKFKKGAITTIIQGNLEVPISVDIFTEFKNADSVVVAEGKQRWTYIFLKFWFDIEASLKRLFGKTVYYWRLNGGNWIEYKKEPRGKK